MADLTITATAVKPVQVVEQFTGPAAEDISAGQYVRFNTTYGKVELGNGSTADEAREGGIALNTVKAGQAVTAVRQGLLDVGNALSSIDFDANIYLSDTDGALADAAGTVSRIVGQVVPAWGATSADKLLRVDL